MKNPHLMAASQVDFTGVKNVTCRNYINSAIVLCWYAELAKFVYFCSVSLHNLFLKSRHPLHNTWSFFFNITSLLVNRTVHPSSQSGSILMSE